MLNVVARTSRMAGIAGIALLAAGMAQADVSLNIGGTEIPAQTLSFNMSYQPVTDPVTYMPVEPARSELSAGSLYLTRNFDVASTQILRRVVSHETLPALDIVVTTPAAGANPGARMVWTLKDAVLNNYGTYSGENSQLVENFDVSYSKATLKTFSGNGTTPVDTLSWDASPAVTNVMVHGE